MLSLPDPSVVWTWNWARFCVYWQRALEWNCQMRIDEQQREIRRKQAELASK